MTMDARKFRILQAIIDDYILTAIPVGSRTISKKYEMGLSSATIRNEMSDLEELGYLDQPHVSAGRIGCMWTSCLKTGPSAPVMPRMCAPTLPTVRSRWRM